MWPQYFDDANVSGEGVYTAENPVVQGVLAIFVVILQPGCGIFKDKEPPPWGPLSARNLLSKLPTA